MTREDPEETKDLGMVLMEDVKPYYTAERKGKLLEEFEVSLVYFYFSQDWLSSSIWLQSLS